MILSRTDKANPPAGTPTVTTGRWIAVLLAFGPALQWTTIGGVLTPGDLIVGPLLAMGLLSRVRADHRQGRLRRRLTVPALIISAGSMLALVDIGWKSWAIKTLVLDAVVAAAFIGVLALVRARKLPAVWFDHSIAASAVFVSTWVLLQGGYRPQATFGQVNMTAHFLASCFVIVLTRGRRRVRYLVLPYIVLAVVTTASFGALLSMGVVLAYVGYGTLRRVMHRSPALLVLLVWGVIVGGASFAVRDYAGNALSSADNTESGFSSNRLERSGNGRKDIWMDGLRALQSDPLGIGPGGFKPQGVHLKNVSGEVEAAEIHHDTLGYLVERGPIGLFGLFCLAFVLWTVGQRRGASRGLILMSVAAGIFRETLHFRHLWIFLAIAVAFDLGESYELPVRRSRARLTLAIGQNRVSRASRLAEKAKSDIQSSRQRTRAARAKRAAQHRATRGQARAERGPEAYSRTR